MTFTNRQQHHTSHHECFKNIKKGWEIKSILVTICFCVDFLDIFQVLALFSNSPSITKFFAFKLYLFFGKKINVKIPLFYIYIIDTGSCGHRLHHGVYNSMADLSDLSVWCKKTLLIHKPLSAALKSDECNTSILLISRFRVATKIFEDFGGALCIALIIV